MTDANSGHPGSWATSITPELISQIPTLSMPQISPDGEWVAWVGSFDARSDLWVAPVAGGEARLISEDRATIAGSPNAPFSGGYGSWFGWMPDGTGLVFTGAGDSQLYLISREGGSATRLSDDPGRHLNPSVLADGRTVVCVVDRGDIDGEIFLALYDVDHSSAKMHRLTSGTLIALDPVPSPDGRSIAFVMYQVHDRWAHHSQIGLIDLDSGSLTQLTRTENVINCRPRWSPDGARLGFLSDRSGFLNVWMVPVSGGVPVSVFPEEIEQNEFAWSDESSQIALLRNQAAEISVHVVDLESRRTRRLSNRRGIYRELTWHKSTIVALHQSPSNPPSVVALDSTSGIESTIASVSIAELDDPQRFVMPEHVSWSAPDGMEIPGLLFTPGRIVEEPLPVLVHLHGGPTGQSMMSWDPVIQYFVARGWIVIQPNYRGSTGYGRKFADDLHGVWGIDDVEDNVASLEMLRSRLPIDKSRCVVWGGSAGGYGVLTALTMQPDIFAAGIDLFGISDWVAMRRDGDRYVHFLADTELGPEATSRDLWIERSPLAHVERITKPLMVFQGTADPRVPKSQSDVMVAAMERAGKDVRYQVYEGEPHGWQRAATIRNYIVQMEQFLNEKVLAV